MKLLDFMTLNAVAMLRKIAVTQRSEGDNEACLRSAMNGNDLLSQVFEWTDLEDFVDWVKQTPKGEVICLLSLYQDHND